MNDYSFGNFLNELRERRGLSQFQLGKLVGVTDKAVSKWENGICKPKTQIIYKLSEVLGVTTDELLSCKYIKSNEEKGVFVMKSQLWKAVKTKLHNKYGDNLPIEILNRYLSEYTELKNSDAILYLDFIGQAIAKANESKEYVRVQGTLGSSFIAFISGASDINPLPPHYYCPKCKKVEFHPEVNCGWDLPEKNCPCGAKLYKDGHNLPFEFLRPLLTNSIHLELSISSSAYPIIKAEAESYFGKNNVLFLKNEAQSDAEHIVFTADKLYGVENGQVFPFGEFYEKFFKYPKIALIKSEELERFAKLKKYTNAEYTQSDIINRANFNAFTSLSTDELPELCNEYVKNMIEVFKPETFYDLIQISGLAHGCGTWENNAVNSIKSGLPKSKIIAYREDVFNIIQAKMNELNIQNTGFAYTVAEDVRKGLYCSDCCIKKDSQSLIDLEMEDWFIESIEKIKYLCPKAQGTAKVKYALMLMQYKLDYPLEFKKVYCKN